MDARTKHQSLSSMELSPSGTTAPSRDTRAEKSIVWTAGGSEHVESRGSRRLVPRGNAGQCNLSHRAGCWRTEKVQGAGQDDYPTYQPRSDSTVPPWCTSQENSTHVKNLHKKLELSAQMQEFQHTTREQHAAQEAPAKCTDP